MIKTLLNITFILLAFETYSQFSPAAGQVGTTAMHKDSSVFINWALEVVSFNPGIEDLTNTQSPIVSFGIPTNATGQAEGNSFDVISLGDGGKITLGFEYPIMNANGPDFAVFENSFSNTYLEFAFVEVSTNGVDYVRFPSTSNTQTNTQTGAFDSTDPTLINNLAGKYSQGYGVPFDLIELIDSTTLNIDSINFIRLVDVVGSIDSTYGSLDINGNLINDPFPSPFNSSGFDLDAVGVIHQNNPLTLKESVKTELKLYPNPASNSFIVKNVMANSPLLIFNLQGEIILKSFCNNLIDSKNLSNGVYIVHINNKEKQEILRLVVNH